MTCIIADKNRNGKIIFVGDRRLSYGDTRYTSSPTPKVFKENGYLIAMSGTVSHFWILKSCASLKGLPTSENPLNHIIHRVIPEFRSNLLKTGQISDKDSEDNDGIHVLLAVNGECFEVSNENGKVHVEKVLLPSVAGCGGDIALSSYATIQNLEPYLSMKLSVKDKLKMAVKIAAKIDSACDDEIDVVQED